MDLNMSSIRVIFLLLVLTEWIFPTILKPRNVFPSAAHVHMILNLNVAQIPCMTFSKRKFKELFLDCCYKHRGIFRKYCLYVMLLKSDMNTCIPVVNYIGGVTVIVLVSRGVDHGFKPQSGQIKDYTISIFWFSAKYAALRRKNRDWLARNQVNMSEWSDMSTRRLLFQ
jgi:hypothetical protein